MSNERGKALTGQVREIRPRQKGPKVKSGCKTCKVRRKKCDEKRPSCSGCVEKGFVCDFSSLPHVVPPTSISPSTTTSPNSCALIPHGFRSVFLTQIQANESDIQNFDYFSKVCTKELSRTFEVTLWQRLVMQVVCIEPCIWHGAVAIGALSRGQHADSLHHYNKSIQHLRHAYRDQAASLELVILASLLFITIEVKQGHENLAHMHMRSAFRILKSMPITTIGPQTMALKPPLGGSTSSIYGPYPNFSLPIDQHPSKDLGELITAFSRLDVQGSPTTNIYLPPTSQIALPPAKFPSLDTARENLNSILAAIARLTTRTCPALRTLPHTPLPSHLSHELNTLTTLLSTWHTSVTALISRHPPTSPQHHATANILTIHHLVASTTLATAFHASQRVYAAHLPAFTEIVRLAAAVAEADTEAEPLRQGPCLVLDIGLVQPLFFVVRRCRDGGVRRRALGVMRGVRREGVVDLGALVGVGEWVIEREEEGMGREGVVGEEGMFEDVELEFGGDGRRCVMVGRRGGGDVRGCVV